MNNGKNTKSARLPAANVVAMVGMATILLLGAFVAANADDRHDHNWHGDRHFHHDRYHGRRDGGYYGPPPVVYGGPAYYPPPVVYGPGVGISLPGVSIGIR